MGVGQGVLVAEAAAALRLGQSGDALLGRGQIQALGQVDDLRELLAHPVDEVAKGGQAIFAELRWLQAKGAGLIDGHTE